jgi:hypothetical protein
MHKHDRCGVSFHSAWFGLLFTATVILLVDDTNFLLMCCDPGISKIEFVKSVQHMAYYWSTLLQATGVYMKDAKCYWYLLAYKFVCDKAELKSIWKVQHLHVSIPQSGSPDVAIHLNDVDDLRNWCFLLSLWEWHPSTLPYDQQRHTVVHKSYEKHLTHQEVWDSLHQQARLSVKYMLIFMCFSDEVDTSFSPWFFNAVSTTTFRRHGRSFLSPTPTKAWGFPRCP